MFITSGCVPILEIICLGTNSHPHRSSSTSKGRSPIVQYSYFSLKSSYCAWLFAIFREWWFPRTAVTFLRLVGETCLFYINLQHFLRWLPLTVFLYVRLDRRMIVKSIFLPVKSIVLFKFLLEVKLLIFLSSGLTFGYGELFAIFILIYIFVISW